MDATIINVLIDKILVSEREKLADGTVQQAIKVYYQFIGFVGELYITPTKRWTRANAGVEKKWLTFYYEKMFDIINLVGLDANVAPERTI